MADMTDKERDALVAKMRPTAPTRRASGSPDPDPAPTYGEPESLESPAESPESPESPEPEPPTVEALERAALRKRLLDGLDADIAAAFTDEELDDIIEAQQKAARDQKKKAALKQIREKAGLEAKAAFGLISADVLMDEAETERANAKVWVTPNVPGGAAGAGDVGFRVSGLLYKHGERRLVPVHVARSLAEMHYRAWFQEIQFSQLDQQKPGRSAFELMAQMAPPFKIEEMLH